MSKILFVGAGKMGTAIAAGLVRSKLFEPGELAAFDINPEAAKLFCGNTKVDCSTQNCAALAAEAQTVLLAVKPQTFADASKLLGDLSGKLVISIIAGMPIDRIAELTGASRIIRVMPNTPALIGRGAAAYAPSAQATAEDCALAGKIFGAVGVAVQIDEKNLDAVTALSGSGPAYVFEFIQSLADGGVAVGLARSTANMLALQTVLGAAEMVAQTRLHPCVLKDQVTSPGGTTIRALEVLEEHAFAGTVIAAVRAACERSAELGKK